MSLYNLDIKNIFAYSGVPNSMYPLSSPSSFQSLYAQHWFVYSLIN
jgi:hypothetical protein